MHSANAKQKLSPLDTVQFDVAVIGQKEMYSWPGRSMFADTQLPAELRSGLVGTGGYAAQVIDVLFAPATQFRWVGRETLAGRPTLRWDFTLPAKRSVGR